MIRPRRLRVLTLLLLASCAKASPLAPAMKAVEEIRGHRFTGEVRTVAIDRSELGKHLEQQMKQGTPYSLEDWGKILRALQLVDVEGSEIVPKLLALYESQVLAFYDPHTHTYYSIRQLPKFPAEMAKLADPKVLEETVMVHELMHALQDQRFGLSTKEKALLKDTDANIAYHAVLEGEAVLVMVAHMLGKSGIKIDEVIQDEAMLGMITSSAAAEQMVDPSTPPYFAQMLKFPYLEGMKFVIAAYRRGGWAELDKVHANPPRTTREILHPEEYFARTFKSEPFDASKPQDAIATEHLGEFHWRFLVGEDAARGWVNDRAVVFRDGRVRIETKWESPERATAFASAYEAFLKKRGVTAAVTREGAVVKAAYAVK